MVFTQYSIHPSFLNLFWTPQLTIFRFIPVILLDHLHGLQYFSLLYMKRYGAVDQLVLIDEFLMKSGAKRLEICLYGRKVPPEVD